MPMLALTATAFTHVGAVRAQNEDTFAIGDWVMSESMDQPLTLERVVEKPCVCLVADGMGGHAAGDVASRFVAEYLVEHAAEAENGDALAGLLRQVDHGLFALMRERPALYGMGSTVAGLHIAPSALSVFNVGDSRVYRIDAAGLCQLSTDDTPGPKLADGRTALHTTSLLSQALGGESGPDAIVPHVLREEVEGERRYLICSDGLTDELEVGELFGLIGADDGASAIALCQAAMAAGGHDNISIVLVRLRPA
jgi:serine/threonine protein phosphatase PrpC